MQVVRGRYCRLSAPGACKAGLEGRLLRVANGNVARTRQGSGKVWASSERSSAKREEVRTICRARMSGCCGDGMRGRTDQQI